MSQKEKTYIDMRGTDPVLLANYQGATTLNTFYGGSTFQPVPQTTPIIPEGK